MKCNKLAMNHCRAALTVVGVLISSVGMAADELSPQQMMEIMERRFKQMEKNWKRRSRNWMRRERSSKTLKPNWKLPKRACGLPNPNCMNSKPEEMLKADKRRSPAP